MATRFAVQNFGQKTGYSAGLGRAGRHAGHCEGIVIPPPAVPTAYR